jgi:hypothetical protein
MDYTLIKNSNGDILSISRSDGASIPVCEGNRDYQEYLEYAEGKTIPEQIIPEPQPDTTPSVNDRIAALELAEIERELGL